MKFIFPIFSIIASIIIFILVIDPYYKDVSVLKSDILVYNTALDNSTNLQKTEDSLLTAYNGIKQSDKDRLGAFLPSSVNNIQFILEVERIANLHNMPIKNIKFEAVKNDNTPTDSNTVVSSVSKNNLPYGVFPIEFTTEGSYDKFVPFLKDLEYNLRLVDIKSITFTVPDTSVKMAAGVDPNSYSYVLKVETYWLK